MSVLLVKTFPQKHLLIYCLAAVLPLMVMGLLFNIPLVTNGSFFPGTNNKPLGYVVQSEFLAAASGILLLIPLLFTIKRRVLRLVPKVLFAVSGFACAWGGLHSGGYHRHAVLCGAGVREIRRRHAVHFLIGFTALPVPF